MERRLFASDDGYDVFNTIELATSSFSAVCTLITLLLIWDIRAKSRWNPQQILVTSMTLAQLLYSLSLIILSRCSDCKYLLYYNCSCAWGQALLMFSGISQTLLINCLIGVIVFVVSTGHSLKLRKYLVRLHLGVLIAAGIPTFLLLLGEHDAQQSSLVTNSLLWYYIVRVASIAANILALVFLWLQLSRLGFVHRKQHPVSVLCRRIVWYPVVQTITRSGAVWFDFLYFTARHPDQYVHHGDYVAWTFVYPILNPLAGVFFFLVFLALQPFAYEAFMRRLRCQPADASAYSFAFKLDGRASLQPPQRKRPTARDETDQTRASTEADFIPPPAPTQIATDGSEEVEVAAAAKRGGRGSAQSDSLEYTRSSVASFAMSLTRSIISLGPVGPGGNSGVGGRSSSTSSRAESPVLDEAEFDDLMMLIDLERDLASDWGSFSVRRSSVPGPVHMEGSDRISVVSARRLELARAAAADSNPLHPPVRHFV